MLRGEITGLRARHDSDIPVLHAGLCADVETRVSADSRPWQPILPGPGSPYVVTGPDDYAACFSVVELAAGELVGEALLWAIDLLNRAARIGISLLPAFRGRGLGTDAVRATAMSAHGAYGFATRCDSLMDARSAAESSVHA